MNQYDIREVIKNRDDFIYTFSDTLRLKDIANKVGLSESRVKGILARMRKEKNDTRHKTTNSPS